jgi:peroxiredoxin
MTRVTLIIILIVGVLGISSCQKKPAPQAEVITSTYTQPTINQLPNMMLIDKNGNRTDANKLKGKNIIILFFPDCDHCKREAAEIADRIKSFEAYTLYFVSINPFEEIVKFAENYHLTSFNNVKFVQTTGDAVYTNFGSVPTPSLYIYDNGKMVRKFNGETRLDEVIKSL